jgi:hypothetical protein
MIFSGLTLLERRTECETSNLTTHADSEDFDSAFDNRKNELLGKGNKSQHLVYRPKRGHGDAIKWLGHNHKMHMGQGINIEAKREKRARSIC